MRNPFMFLTDPPRFPMRASLDAKKGRTGQSFPVEKVKISLDDELLRFSSHHSDRWYLRDAVRGTQVFGAIGSGKTSGSGKKIAKAFLKKGMGGLVLCVKTDEAQEWEELIAKTGREKDLVRIKADSSYRFNFLNWEQKRFEGAGGGLAVNVTDFFMEIISAIDRGNGKSEDGFWDRTIRELLSNAITIASHLSPSLSISDLLRVIDHAPQSPRGVEDGQEPSSHYRAPTSAHSFDLLCAQARSSCLDLAKPELEKSIFFFNQRFAGLAEKTKSIVIASFTSMADPLLREPLLSLFCGETSIKPEDCFEGKIVVVDLPVHSFQFIGRIANLIWKGAFKRACQQRCRPETPVFLWIDESQYLMDTSDGAFQTTARSSLCCSVFLTQTISNLYAELGSRPKVESLMSCLHTKIFHQNDDHEMNTWASKTIQKLPMKVKSESGPKDSLLSSNKKSVSESIHWEDDVPGRAFLNLASGGPENHFLVEGIVLNAGRRLSSGKPWIKANFDQKSL